MRALVFVAVWVVVASGCGPASGLSRFGHVEVESQSDALSGLSGTLRISVGGVAAYAVERVDARTVKYTVQGHWQSGEAAVVATTPSGSVELGRLSYAPVADPRLERLVAFGASLTMGSQDASISPHSQLYGPAAQLARATGAYLGLPLVKEGVMPALTLADIDDQRCTTRVENPFAVVGARIETELIDKLRGPDGDVAIGRARIDPSLESRNLAIGGFRIAESVGGAQSFIGTVLEHLVWDSQVDAAGLVQAPQQTMLDRVVALQPTTVVTTDLFGNDFNNVDVYAEGVPDLRALTPTETVRANLRTVLARLEPLHTELFIATGPDATLLPQYDEKIARLEAQGYSAAEATGWRDGLRARIAEYNQVLREEAAGRAWVHVVELAATVEDVFAHGVEVKGTHLSGAPFGGLLSLDSMHFSDTGYAVMANLFLDAMDQAWGTTLPRVDVAKVLEGDPRSVANLKRQGLSCAGTR